MAPARQVESPIKSLHEALAKYFEPSVREVDDDDEKDPVSQPSAVVGLLPPKPPAPRRPRAKR